MIALVPHWESSHADERRLDYPREGLSVAEGPRLQAAGATAIIAGQKHHVGPFQLIVSQYARLFPERK
ncbi:hypothetical protein NQZ68_000405 [Dissostichus eleginoides]|nr:hypothetical protein NQZ68_000405 [Dissostichus eleginoides]